MRALRLPAPLALSLSLSLSLLLPGSLPARDLEEIVDSGELRVIFLTFDHSPYFDTSPEGEPAGLDYDLLQRFARRHRLRLVVDSVRDVQEVLDRVQSGAADVAAGGISASADRQQRVDFTTGITPQRHTISTWRRPPVESAEEVRSLRIATAPGTSWAAALDELEHPSELRVHPSGEFSPETFVATLQNGEADAAATGLVFALLMRREAPGIGLGLHFGERGHHSWGVEPGSDALRAALDKLLVDVQTSDAWEPLVAGHFGADALDLFRRAER